MKNVQKYLRKKFGLFAGENAQKGGFLIKLSLHLQQNPRNDLFEAGIIGHFVPKLQALHPWRVSPHVPLRPALEPISHLQICLVLSLLGKKI